MTTPPLDLTQFRMTLHAQPEIASAREEAFEIYCNPCSNRTSTNEILDQYADALLIAAAPQLLEEVKRLRAEAVNRNEELERWQEFTSHLSWCANCAQDGLDSCDEGRGIRVALDALSAAANPAVPYPTEAP